MDIILAEWVEEKEEGLAIMNRMIRSWISVVDTPSRRRSAREYGSGEKFMHKELKKQ